MNLALDAVVFGVASGVGVALGVIGGWCGRGLVERKVREAVASNVVARSALTRASAESTDTAKTTVYDVSKLLKRGVK